MTKNQDFQLCADMGLLDQVEEWARKNPELIDFAIEKLSAFSKEGKVPYKPSAFLDLARLVLMNSRQETDRLIALALGKLEEIALDRPFTSERANKALAAEYGSDNLRIEKTFSGRSAVFRGERSFEMDSRWIRSISNLTVRDVLEIAEMRLTTEES